MPTTIEWTGESWNPIRARTPDGKVGWHCEHASPGCQNCYAETRNLAGRCNLGTKLPFKPGHRKDVEIWLDEAALAKPLGWKKGRKVFVCSMTDLFADFVTDEMLDRIFAVMALCPQHTFQVLTKRAGRMRDYLCTRGGDWMIRWPDANPTGSLRFSRQQQRIAMQGYADGSHPRSVTYPLPNVWLGVSVEDQQRADERIPDLLATPAALRWISAEPLLGPVDLRGVWTHCPTHDFRSGFCVGPCPDRLGIDWVVVGGESGSKARPMHPDWARSLRDQCAAAGVPFFFKQWGLHLPHGQVSGLGQQWGREEGELRFMRGTKVITGRLLDGVEHNGMPMTTEAPMQSP